MSTSARLTSAPTRAAARAPTAATTTQAVTASLPPGAAVGSAGFPIESFTFTFRGNFFDLSSFLGRVQRFVVIKNHRVTVSGRLLTINAISHRRRTRGLPPDHRDDLRHRVPRADVAGRDGGRDRDRTVDRVKRLDEREHLGLQLRNHDARRRRDLPDSMNFLQPLITDLREKRLWPVVVVLVGALVAVPVLLAKPAPKPQPAIAATGAGATITSPISGLPVVELSTTPQFSHLPGHGRDPFTQQTSTTSTGRRRRRRVLPARAAPVVPRAPPVPMAPARAPGATLVVVARPATPARPPPPRKPPRRPRR